MKSSVNNPTTVIATYLWIGSICSISFLEAWLKFRAPGITLALGLGIGKLVFAALNKLEWAFFIAILFNTLIPFFKQERIQSTNYILLIPFIVLSLQTLWLLPSLSMRADKIIQGHFVEPSNIHFYYVAAEVIKVISLVYFGHKIFKKE